MTKSFIPVIVTICCVFQFAFVKLRLVGDTVPSAVFELDTVIDTVVVGLALRLTAKYRIPPDSVVI